MAKNLNLALAQVMEERTKTLIVRESHNPKIDADKAGLLTRWLN